MDIVYESLSLSAAVYVAKAFLVENPYGGL
jgi:hypothetical protein